MMEMAGTVGGTARLRAGEQVRATVISVTEDWVFLDVGTPSDGRIARAELANSATNAELRPGISIQATVVDPRPDGPLLAVSLGHGERLDTSSLEAAQRTGTPISAEVTRVVKGGLEVTAGGARAFCPASQIELGHVADMAAYVGQQLEFRVLEVRDRGRSIVLSRRALLEERRREAARSALERIVVGAFVEATVQSLGRHGANVTFDEVEGFIHVSELAPHRVERAEDAVQVGEQVRARVLSVEQSPKGPRVRLSLRDASGAKEPDRASSTPPDEVLAATVVRPLPHGVIVQTSRGEGVVPVRELGLAPGADHRRAFQPGRELEVVAIGGAAGRMTFSATRVSSVQERKNFKDFAGQSAAAPARSLGSLGDLLAGRLKGIQPSSAPLPPASSSSPPVGSAEPTSGRSGRSDVLRRRR